MELPTSTKAYEEYQRLRLMEERVNKNNRGMTLFGQSQSESLYIKVRKIVEGNLLETKKVIVVDSNLPFARYSYHYNDTTITEFLKQLDNFVKIPIFKNFIVHNRKYDNKISDWDLPKFRDYKIEMDEIEITFGEEACKDIDVEGFKKSVSIALKKQKEVSPSQEKEFNRYVLLLNKIKDLGRQKKESSYGGYSYGSYESKSTIKISISNEEHDKKLSEIENELKKLKKKYSFLEIPNIYYQKKEDEEEDDDDYDDDEECEELY